MTTRLLAAAAGALFGLAVAGPACAEVRYRCQPGGGTPTLEIQPTPRGPWSPVGALSPESLNPTGDLVGDGYPGHAGAAGRRVVAWVSPAADAVELGQVVSSWTPWPTIPAPAARGTPVVNAVGPWWTVAWNVGGTSPFVQLGVLRADGHLTHVELVSGGHLVTSVVMGDRLSLMVLSAEGRTLTAFDFVLSLHPNGPIPILFRTATVLAAPSAEPLPLLGRWRSPGHTFLGADIRSHEGVGIGGPYALLTWWAAPQELRFVEIDKSGPVLPVESLRTPGRAPYASSLVVEAVRQVSRR